MIGYHEAVTEPVAEVIAIVIAVATMITAGYIIRDRRAKVMRDLFETERVRSDELAKELGDARSENALLKARPNIDEQFHLVEKLLEKMDTHENQAQARAERHEERAQKRSDATVLVLKEIAENLKTSEGGK